MRETMGTVADELMREAIKEQCHASIDRRNRWNEAVYRNLVHWREQFGYKNGPLMDPRLVEREFKAMATKVIEGRLLTLLAPLMTTVDVIDKCIFIIGIFASPSNAGPEKYAPKLSKHNEFNPQREFEGSYSKPLRW